MMKIWRWWGCHIGIVPAPETARAVRAAIKEALDCKKKKEERILFFDDG